MAYRRGGTLITFNASYFPARLFFHLALTLVRLVDRLLFRLRIEGRNNLEQLDSALLVSNHTLVLDPGILAHAIRPRRTYFTMLEETACIPFLGTFVRLLGAVPIPARAASMRILERAIRTELQDLPFVHVFPEGECYLWNQQIEAFQQGAFFLACRLGLPVVPLTTVLHKRSVLGRECFCLAGRCVRVPPRVTVVIGTPVSPGKGVSVKQEALHLSREIRMLMQRTIDERRGSKSLYRGRMKRLAPRHIQAGAAI